MSEPSEEATILRRMLDIHEQSTRALRDAGIELPRDDVRRLKRLEKKLADATGRD